MPYINNRREDWSFLCENNRIVAKEDQIVFKYEPFFLPDKDILNLNGLNGSPLEDNVGSGNHPSTKAANSRTE